tara:strand:- start:205 stop:429 length:225 start_codon:yes stop_codon:yes gene_type:complete
MYLGRLPLERIFLHFGRVERTILTSVFRYEPNRDTFTFYMKEVVAPAKLTDTRRYVITAIVPELLSAKVIKKVF